MGHLPLLDELAIIAALAVVVTLVLGKLRLPTVAGLLAAGALVGPHGLALARSVSAIEVLAEVGVVLLLFGIGLEFSLARLSHIFRRVALGGVLQVGVTALATYGIARAAGLASGVAVLFGFVVSLSSTAIVLRALGERRELDAPHGRFIVGTLLFQDLAVIPMVLVVPLLAGVGTASALMGGVALALGKAALVVAVTLGLARFVVPRLLGWVDQTHSREVFLLTILSFCIGTAWLTAQAGLSLALGAFLGGMVVADTEYRHRAMGDILPLRDAFVSLFFLSLGMLFDVRVVLREGALVALLLLGFVLAKGLLATLAALFMRFPRRAAWLAGVGLAQFGEFGFVLTRLGVEHGVTTAEEVRPLLTAGILSMFLTPLLVRLGPHVTAGERLLAPLERLLGVQGIDEADQGGTEEPRGHVVLVGFGVAGHLAARALEAVGGAFVALDLDAEKVRRGRALGLPVFYGDATSEEALGHAHLGRARLLVLLMNDPQAAERVVATARRVAPSVPVLMRTRLLADTEALARIGASEVVVEEVEGALECIARMLQTLEVPRGLVEQRLALVRAETRTGRRRLALPRPRVGEVSALDDLEVEVAVLGPGDHAVGATLRELDLRARTGALVVAVRRGDAPVEPPDPGEPLAIGDRLYLVGDGAALEAAAAALRTPGAPSR